MFLTVLAYPENLELIVRHYSDNDSFVARETEKYERLGTSINGDIAQLETHSADLVGQTGWRRYRNCERRGQACIRTRRTIQYMHAVRPS